MRRHVPHQLQNKRDIFDKSCEFSESCESSSIALALSREAEEKQVFSPPGHRDKLGLDCFGYFCSFHFVCFGYFDRFVSFRWFRFAVSGFSTCRTLHANGSQRILQTKPVILSPVIFFWSVSNYIYYFIQFHTVEPRILQLRKLEVPALAQNPISPGFDPSFSIIYYQ